MRAELDLGEVREVAEVRVNGTHVATLLWPPYRADLTGHLRPGDNTLSVVVTNTPANAMGESLASGLLGPVTATLQPARTGAGSATG
jgi:hypothetical protein